MCQNKAVAALGALAQDTRLTLFRLLVTAGPAGLSAGTIAERLGGAPPSLSFPLQPLLPTGKLSAAPEYAGKNAPRPPPPKICGARGGVCAPACNPAEAFTEGEPDEA